MMRKQRDPVGYENEMKAKRAKKEAEFNEPPLLGLVTRIFRGIKYEIKKIHIRFEDDYFAHEQPFSFGFTIEHIKMDNQIEEEERQRR